VSAIVRQFQEIKQDREIIAIHRQDQYQCSEVAKCHTARLRAAM